MLLLLALAACTPEPQPPTQEGSSTTEATTDTVNDRRCPDDHIPHEAFLIAPYVQLVQPTSAWILWETQTGLESRVDFGTDNTLASTACGSLVPLLPGDDPTDDHTLVHEVELTGLAPSTLYHYRVQTGDGQGEILQFKTAPDPADETSFRLVAMGDSQRDDAFPDRYQEVVQDGVMAVAGDASLVLFAGDLVDNGWFVDEWKDEFFAPGAALMSGVPFYPVLGNHEAATPHYFRYFHLPDNGDSEHYYHFDHSNVRVIGLDSNAPYSDVIQLSWLDDVLAETCGADAIDFVFAQVHHPFLSELWTPGNLDWTGEVVARLEAFSADCDKPSIHFYGHTHGYSRGQTQAHKHVMVNVSSAGGALDRWGEQPQEDYPAFSVSEDTYGFVVVDVEAGDDPTFSLQRISRGTPDAAVENVVSDTVTVPRYNIPPDTPTAVILGPVCPAALLTGSVFADADLHSHQASHWQIGDDCGDFTTPIFEAWVQHENRYFGVDTQAGDNLEDHAFSELEVGVDYCWRVRYRDSGLAWSAWSAAEVITPVDCG